MMGLPGSEKTLRICITVYNQYRCVTDGQTDGRTDRHLATAQSYAYALRGNNNYLNEVKVLLPVLDCWRFLSYGAEGDVVVL